MSGWPMSGWRVDRAGAKRSRQCLSRRRDGGCRRGNGSRQGRGCGTAAIRISTRDGGGGGSTWLCPRFALRGSVTQQCEPRKWGSQDSRRGAATSDYRTDNPLRPAPAYARFLAKCGRTPEGPVQFARSGRPSKSAPGARNTRGAKIALRRGRKTRWGQIGRGCSGPTRVDVSRGRAECSSPNLPPPEIAPCLT